MKRKKKPNNTITNLCLFSYTTTYNPFSQSRNKRGWY